MLSRRAYLAATFENAADWELRCLLRRLESTAVSSHPTPIRETVTGMLLIVKARWHNHQHPARAPGADAVGTHHPARQFALSGGL